MADTQLQQLFKTDRNPSQEGDFKNLLSSQGIQFSADSSGKVTDVMGRGRGGNSADANFLGSGGNMASGVGQAPSFNDTLNNAKQLQQFNVQANQPAIQSLQGQSTDLKQRYSDLLDSIKGQGSVAVNAQTLATNNEMGRRGILPSSGLYEQQMAQSLLPATSQTSAQLSQTGVAEQQDVNTIANQIAALQTGNPEAATSAALGILGNQTQLGAAQIGANAQIQGAQIQAQTQTQYNDVLSKYYSGQISNEQAKNALELLQLQKVTLPEAQANITSSLAGAGASSASAAMNNYMLGQYQNGGLSVTNPTGNSSIPQSLRNAAGF